MLTTKITTIKLLLLNLMHGTTAVSHSTYLICIKFFPINGLSFTH
nr:MAG TPA: hypothetical protein [Caudoviricetes sp.]